jgi:hypothetical protein
LIERTLKHATQIVEGWLYDFCQSWELPLEQGESNQARNFVRCCSLQRQRPQQLLQHEWLREAWVAVRVFQLGQAGS